MRKRKKEWVDQFREVIREIKENSFSSHDFIGKFCKMYEPEWKQLLERHETGANQKVNAYIARMLSLYAKDVQVQKMKELKPSKNIHASTSRVHWWKKVTALLLLFMTAKIIYAEEYDQRSTFLQHIKGWEWVYMEQGRTKEIKTPYYSVTYKEYDSHPEYRVVFEDNMYEGMKTSVTIYDTDGNLVRQLTEVPGWYNYSNVKENSRKLTNKELYHIARGEKISQSLAKIPSFIPKDDISDEELLENNYDYKYEIGYISRIKKNEARIIDELNSQIKDQHMQIIFDNSHIICCFDSVYIDNLYEEICKSRFGDGFKKAVWIISANETGIRRKRLQLNFQDKTRVIDSLCYMQMAADYMNNLYDVKTREGAETRMLIEKELGITKESLRYPDEGLINIGKNKCEALGLPIDEKYFNMGEVSIMKEMRKYHPDWTYLDIANQYSNAIKRMAIDIAEYALNVKTNSSKNIQTPSNASKKAAYNYMNSLIEEYQFNVMEIRRVNENTFEATIEIAPRGTLYKIIIHYRQAKPYEYVNDVQIVS